MLDRFDKAVLFSNSYPDDPNRTFAGEEEYKALMKILSYPQSSECPFCKQCPCSHWNGIGFINPNYHNL